MFLLGSCPLCGNSIGPGRSANMEACLATVEAEDKREERCYCDGTELTNILEVSRRSSGPKRAGGLGLAITVTISARRRLVTGYIR